MPSNRYWQLAAESPYPPKQLARPILPGKSGKSPQIQIRASLAGSGSKAEECLPWPIFLHVAQEVASWFRFRIDSLTLSEFRTTSVTDAFYIGIGAHPSQVIVYVAAATSVRLDSLFASSGDRQLTVHPGI